MPFSTKYRAITPTIYIVKKTILYSDIFIFLKNLPSYILKDKDTINLKKDIFDNLDNDPRLKGVSATSKNRITKIF